MTDTASPTLSPRTRRLLEAPVLGTLLRLAAPNVGEAAARIAFIAGDSVFVGWLGTDALAEAAPGFALGMLAAGRSLLPRRRLRRVAGAPA